LLHLVGDLFELLYKISCMLVALVLRPFVL